MSEDDDEDEGRIKPGEAPRRPDGPAPKKPGRIREYGGVIPWGTNLSVGSLLDLPKQPADRVRLMSIAFDWSNSGGGAIETIQFGIIWKDGAGNVIARVTHDVCGLNPVGLAQAAVTAHLGSGIIQYPEVTLTGGTMTFGLSLIPSNIGVDPSALIDGTSGSTTMNSEHPLPWNLLCRPEGQVSVQLVAKSAAASVTVPQVVYRFRDF